MATREKVGSAGEWLLLTICSPSPGWVRKDLLNTYCYSCECELYRGKKGRKSRQGISGKRLRFGKGQDECGKPAKTNVIRAWKATVSPTQDKPSAESKDQVTYSLWVLARNLHFKSKEKPLLVVSWSSMVMGHLLPIISAVLSGLCSPKQHNPG